MPGRSSGPVEGYRPGVTSIPNSGNSKPNSDGIDEASHGNALRVFITGANRGIGHELARRYVSAGHRVWGSARADRSDRLADLQPAGVIVMDLADEASIVAGIGELATQVDAIDLLINCAGVDGRNFGASEGARGPFDLDGDVFTDVIRVNATGPMIVTREALGLLRAAPSPTVVNVSSQLGSMRFAKNAGRDTAYCVSKAALNMLTVKTAAAFASDGITAVAIHPGWVSTDMGGPSASLTPQESADAIVETVSALSIADSGRFLTWDGRDHDW